jgi:hypothetical protein
VGKVKGVIAGQGGGGMVFADEEIQGFAAVSALGVVHPASINPDNLSGIGALDGEVYAEASLLGVIGTGVHG